MTPTRREFIQTAAVAAPALTVLGSAALNAPAAQAAGTIGNKNIVLFITDQDRAIQHFPPNWAKDNLPGLQRLLKHGVAFDQAFCCTCMCSPSRASMMTGYFPAQHEVRYTLEENMPASQYPQVPLSTSLKNLASVMTSAGYDVVYKGKWHLSKPEGETAAPSDLEAYGFSGWDPPDAGANQSVAQAGGGSTNNDGRYMDSVGDDADGTQGVLQYLKTQASADQPFCLVVSLVNPHDVLLYPKAYQSTDYDDTWLNGEVELPQTWDEDLSTKPTVQRAFRSIFALGSGPLPTPEEKRNYINFYANLMKSSDAYLVEILDALVQTQLLDDTLVVRTSDHGEMGMAHGGLRQKVFNVYDETMNIPLVYSNPKLFPRGRTTNDLVSHADLLPTLAGLVGAPSSGRADWEGVDYSAQVLGHAKKPVQDYVVFTFDDTQCGQAHGPYVPPPGNIVSIREKRWKIAEYYDPNGIRRSQWEMYDLANDPLEKHNLARSGFRQSGEQHAQYLRLRRKLRKVQATRLQPLPNAGFAVLAMKVDGDSVTSSVRVPTAGKLVQRIAWDDGVETVIAGTAHKNPTHISVLSLSVPLSQDTLSRIAEGQLELAVRTSFLPGAGGAETITDQFFVGAGTPNNPTPSNPAFTG